MGYVAIPRNVCSWGWHYFDCLQLVRIGGEDLLRQLVSEEGD